jgi:hypothetical protein
VKINKYDHIHTGVINLRIYTEDAMRARITYEIEIGGCELGGATTHIVSEDHLVLWQQL